MVKKKKNDTDLFLKDTNLIKTGINLVQTLSDASGLQLNITNCAGLSLHGSSCVTSQYKIVIFRNLCIKNVSLRQGLNFNNKKKKTNRIFDHSIWRDLSMLGRVLLVLLKAEGLFSPAFLYLFRI